MRDSAFAVWRRPRFADVPRSGSRVTERFHCEQRQQSRLMHLLEVLLCRANGESIAQIETRRGRPVARINFLAPLLAALSCVSCSAELNPLDMHIGGTARQRPETTIGPAVNGLHSEWRVVKIWLPSSQIRNAASFDSTVHLSLSDCEGATLAIDDIYVSGLSLNEISRIPAATFKGRIGPSTSVAAVFYVREDLFQREPKICGSISGGGMVLGQTHGHEFVLKR